ncbi:EAL domain-containing protein [Actinokineospora sp. NBRC 105648]|uniref:putative bifunctional diguanylate cyclase/phosphodiesterase n=1 Tax=Actinokineospora sp. NBRC 105648 TaxID=3032206 RepID=UPI0024A40C10|nr:EAL domain-containing protein [Actinokineospora sp. NBRC 105648]GLZ39039.1 signal transduction protein [Actinokineospora sp. NBRC 105648]
MDRAELAIRWAAALTQVAYVARDRDVIERELADLLGALVACLRADGPDEATGVGRALAESGFHQPVCVRVSIDVLSSGLPRLTEVDDATRLPGVLAALAAGFADATRRRLFAEQQDLRDALVHARNTVERDLRASEARFGEVFTTSALGMVISDLGGGVARANEALEEMLGYKPGTLFRKRLDDLFHPQDRAYLRTRYDELADGVGHQLDERTRFLRADGETQWVRVAVSVLRDRDDLPDHHVTMVQDISDLHLLEHHISHQGTHDPLTGLPNRQAFVGRLEEALGTGQEVSVLHLGLDDFAVTNDGIGRAAGDHLLREVAARLTQLLGEQPGIVARLAGDEFAMMLEHPPGGLDVGGVATEINDVLSEPTYVDGQGIAAWATIAVVSLPSADTKPDELLRATDIALRKLKQRGRRQWCVVDPVQNQLYREQYRLAATIPGAWENGELGLELRPVVALAERTVVATEALLRWEHPEYGVLGPQRCAELLLDTGLSVLLGHWVLGQAAAAVEGSALYLELSAEQVADPDLVMQVRRVLGESGLDADRLELGMPVCSLSIGDGVAEDNLGVLVDLGVRTVLTDFGHTRGDLACLEDLPIHSVRMSGAVVSRVVRPDPAALFTRSVAGLVPMVREVGISVLVPGISTEEQAKWWMGVGADLGTGPLFS